jgi:hypothetical protein
MEFASSLALVLLTLVGYSSGAVLGARRRMPVPDLADLLVIVALWAAALLTRPALGRWPALAVWLAAGLLVGALLARARLVRYAAAASPAPTPAQTASIPARVWQAWKGFARRMGNYQSRVMMACLYFTVVLPFGLAVSTLSDPLHIKRTGGPSNWRSKHMLEKPSLEEAWRQF